MTLTQAFRDQSATCTRMGSPFMGTLLKILSEHWDSSTPLGQAMATYTGDIGPAGHSLPLRIAAGLHALVLSGKDATLKAVYPPAETDPDRLRRAVLKALADHTEFLLDWTRLPPQTNEMRRSAALIAMGHVALSRFNRPIILSELGASGGLNLLWDRYAVEIAQQRFGAADPLVTFTPDWTGPLPPLQTPHIVARAGVDLNPLAPRDPTDRLRMSSYLWADQPSRMDMLAAAAPHQVHSVHKGDAIEWLEHRLDSAAKGHLHIIQHTVAWQYFPHTAQTRGRSLIEAAGARATEDSPLAWMSMETDGDTTGKVGAALTLRLWPGDITLDLGRADFHGRWIKWDGRAAA